MTFTSFIVRFVLKRLIEDFDNYALTLHNRLDSLLSPLVVDHLLLILRNYILFGGISYPDSKIATLLKLEEGSFSGFTAKLEHHE